jgi:excisionase family DNA binding protein
MPWNDGLQTAKQVSTRLGVSVDTVWRLARTGELPFVTIGRLRRFEPSDVEAYIERSRVAVRPIARSRRGGARRA